MQNQDVEANVLLYSTGPAPTSSDRMIDDSEDDVHLCLNCHSKIQGLENYIAHRRQKCRANEKPSNLGTTSFIIEADPNNSNGGPLIRVYHHQIDVSSRGSRSDPILSSSSTHIEAHLKQTESSLVPDLSVEVSADDFMSHLGLCSSAWAGDIHSVEEPLRADDFFSLLELQSCAKTSSNQPKTPEVKQRPRLKPSEVSPNTPSSGDRQQANRSTEEPSDNIELHSPRNRAESPDMTSEMTVNFDTPVKSSQVVLSEALDPSGPAPFPSRGKWMPGLRPRDIHKSGSSVEYHCKPCNRRLTGRVVYEKHLQSELHFKRVAQNMAAHPESAASMPHHLRRKRTPHPSQQQQTMIDLLEEDADMSWLKKRRIDKDSVRCATCRACVPRSVFGKHLVSRFHVSRSLHGADLNHPHAQFILEHIELIVREAPFQCRLCRFYSHSHADLIRHWNTSGHKERDLSTTGTWNCGLCRFNCPSGTLMLMHLQSASHTDCVSMINKSVTMAVAKLVAVQCHLCSRLFRFNIQLNRHILTDHQLSVDELNGRNDDRVKSCFTCDHCPFKSTSKSVITHHMFKCRSAASKSVAPAYRCLICRLSFSSKQQVRQHRSSQQHRDVAGTQKSGSSRSRTCPHCYQHFDNLLALKDHLQETHPQLLPRCTICGNTFALKQQLSAHK